MTKQFKTLDQVWNAIDQGLTVYWASDAYQLTIETVDPDYRIRMGWGPTFSQRDTKALRVTCISNWFGSFLDPNELGNLYVKSPKV